MPAVTKPTSIHVLQGTAQKCRIEKRKGELKVPAVMPAAPDWMPTEAKVEWGRVISLSQYARALSESDRAMLTAYCVMWAEIVTTVTRDGSSENIPSSRLMAFIQMASRLGMTPSDRVKIRLPEEKPVTNKFAKLGS